jgi:uncharacterized repeat protein (TIGR03803 family)
MTQLRSRQVAAWSYRRSSNVVLARDATQQLDCKTAIHDYTGIEEARHNMRTVSVMASVLVVLLAAFLAGCSGAAPTLAALPVAGDHTGFSQIGPNDHVEPSYSRPLPSATKTVLYEFHGGDGGGRPDALTPVSGTLYGTTEVGGTSSYGIAFKITPSGKEATLYNFLGGSDGAFPVGSMVDVNGTLFGTTEVGGTSNYGTVYTITPAGKETVLYRFAGGTDGSNPFAGLTNVNGTLYGTTAFGGASGLGTVFKVTTSGNESVLYSFAGGSDGAAPYSSLTNLNGTLYGTTSAGGGASGGNGTVFKITTSGKETVLHRFTGGSDGTAPYSGLANVSGTLYGSTSHGGGSSCFGFGCGIVFTITPSGMETIVYRFLGGSDGAVPTGNLISMNGAPYGTTSQGGGPTRCDRLGCGTVFTVNLSGLETVLYKFTGGSDGASPESLTGLNGKLFGTTYGKRHGAEQGTVFALSL